MINLDDRDAILKTQGGDAVLNSVDALAKQLEQSYEESRKVSFPSEYKQISNIMLAGMGGSRFPALILRELFKEELKVPLVINDDYTIPGFVKKDTLVILSSYSGTTEEVIENGKKAKALGVKLAGVTAGGEVASMLKEAGAPVYVFDPKYNPSTQPRIGFGYAVGGLLGLLTSLGLVDVGVQKVKDSIAALPSLLKPFTIDVPGHKNPAKQLAQKLYGRYPYYIVSEFLTGIGNAIANQTNETAKSISSFRIIPELNHHLMEGLKFPKEHQKMAMFVFFYSSLFSSPIQKRFHITKEVVEQNGIETYWRQLQGANKIEQAFELMGLGSYVSMYLSVLYEQNPSAIPYVDYFKKKLKEMK